MYKFTKGYHKHISLSSVMFQLNLQLPQQQQQQLNQNQQLVRQQLHHDRQ
jgi:hypothetical protein